jgi:UDP:flavonoid glycosyltransferase YjiC (YdhE family)
MGLRVLVTSPAGLGHIQPMVPLAQAMVARGHDVLWAAPADGVDHVRQTGIRAVATGAAGLTRPADVVRRYPELRDLSPAEMPNRLFGKMFGAVAAPSILADLQPLALEWRPQLVVADAAEFAGHIVAAELGVPSVTKGFGPLLPEQRVAGGSDEVATLWRSRGMEPRLYGGSYDHLYLDIFPPVLPTDAVSHVPCRQLLRPDVADGRTGTDAALPLPQGGTDLPLVYVTMGTVFNSPAPLRMVLDALADLPVRILVTVGPDTDRAVLGTQPAHIRVERYVPQTLVLPHCHVVVSHGGSGTVLSSLALGLPQMCLPQGADQFLNAAAVATSGAGISLVPLEATAPAIRDAAIRLISEASFRSAAAVVAASIASMPSPDAVAAVLEALV